MTKYKIKYKVGTIITFTSSWGEEVYYCRIKEIKKAKCLLGIEKRYWGYWVTDLKNIDKEKYLMKSEWGYISDKDLGIKIIEENPNSRIVVL